MAGVTNIVAGVPKEKKTDAVRNSPPSLFWEKWPLAPSFWAWHYLGKEGGGEKSRFLCRQQQSQTFDDDDNKRRIFRWLVGRRGRKMSPPPPEDGEMSGKTNTNTLENNSWLLAIKKLLFKHGNLAQSYHQAYTGNTRIHFLKKKSVQRLPSLPILLKMGILYML